MSIRNKIFAMGMLLATSQAAGDGLSTSINPGLGGGIGGFDGGISFKTGTYTPPVMCAATGLKYGNTCNTVYKMGIFQ